MRVADATVGRETAVVPRASAQDAGQHSLRLAALRPLLGELACETRESKKTGLLFECRVITHEDVGV